MIIEKFGGTSFHTCGAGKNEIHPHKGRIMGNCEWLYFIKPATTREGDATWQAKDDKAFALFASGLEDTYIHNIGTCNSSNCAWETLEKTYGAQGLNSKISLKVEFYSLEMKINVMT